MDNEIAWEECVDDIPIDTRDLPSLDALSSNSTHLPDIDLLDLFSLDQNVPQHQTVVATSPRHEIHEQKSIHSSPQSNSSLTVKAIDSPVTSASPEPSSPNSSSTQSGRDSSNCSQLSGTKHFPQRNASDSPNKSTNDNITGLSDQSQLVLELSTRLASAGAEATALRKRVAALSSENRSLRTALDHANARLLAVAQAATTTTHPSTTQPMMLGLAHVTSDVASRLAGALTVSDPHATAVNTCNSNTDSSNSNVENHHVTQPASQQRSKKRKRVTGAAATTMACVMFMWGALVGSPGWLSSNGNSTSRTQGALPALWSGGESQQHTALASVNTKGLNDRRMEAWQPNCMRVLEPLPDGKEAKKTKREPLVVVGGNADKGGEDADEHTVENEMFVDVMDNEATAKVVATADHYSDKLPKYSYVLCRDTQTAMDNVKACTKRMKDGHQCGQPHTISLILPASAAGLDDGEVNETGSAKDQTNHLDLAEVQCTITSVARIPIGEGKVGGGRQGGTSSREFGRVIGNVRETGTTILG